MADYEENEDAKRSRSRSPLLRDGSGDGDGSRPAKRRYTENPRREGGGSRARSRSRSGSNEGRNDEGDDDENSNYELRLLLPAKDAGAVIGKGGSNISKLRAEHRARVTFSSSRTPERVLIVSGNFDALKAVTESVYRSIEEKYSSGASRRGFEVTAKVLIHQSQAGCVIGRAGSQLKEFRHKYGVDIKVFATCCPQSTERITQMIGRTNGVAKCIVSICKMLSGWPPKGFQCTYDPDNYDPSIVQDYGGYEDEERMGGGRFGGGGGGGGRGDRDGGYYGPSLSDLASLVPKKSTQKVSIPTDLAGVIIGKSGMKIRQIRADSGAEVELSDMALPGDRIITISGTPDQIQNAQYLLQTCVKQHLALNRN